MRPPEWVDAQYLILLEDGPNPPTAIICKRVTVLAEKSVDPRNASVPRVLQILECQTTILRIGFLALKGILRPNSLRINKFTLPGL